MIVIGKGEDNRPLHLEVIQANLEHIRANLKIFGQTFFEITLIL